MPKERQRDVQQRDSTQPCTPRGAEQLRAMEPHTLRRLQSKYNFSELAMVCVTNESMEVILGLLCILSEREKSQHKFRMTFPGGQVRIFRYDANTELLCHCTKDSTLMILVNYHLAQEWKETLIGTNQCSWSSAEWQVEHEATRTGNHRGRRHHVQVPTAPGQPVRG